MSVETAPSKAMIEEYKIFKQISDIDLRIATEDWTDEMWSNVGRVHKITDRQGMILFMELAITHSAKDPSLNSEQRATAMQEYDHKRFCLGAPEEVLNRLLSIEPYKTQFDF
jgi:hypothetical protein